MPLPGTFHCENI